MKKRARLVSKAVDTASTKLFLNGGNKMLKRFLLLIIGLVVFSAASFAEETAPAAVIAADPEVQAMSNSDIVMLTVSTIRLQRQYVVASAMKLSDTEGAAFWPVYGEYWEEMGASRERLMKLVDNFVTNHKTLTNEQANAMTNEYLLLRQEEFTIKQKYVEKFKMALPAMKVIRYYQIENKLDSIVAYEAAKAVPLAETA